MIKRFLSSISMKSFPFIKVTDHGSTGVVQLNRPEALNALSLEMFQQLHEIIQALEGEKEVVIFKGLGKVFCAGGDVKQFVNSPSEKNLIGWKYSRTNYDLIANYKIPYVALVDGLAMGGAAIYSVPAKYSVATERTAFAMPETAIGYYNDAGASYFLSRLDKNLGVYMGMTGARVTGHDMVRVKLATHYVTSDKMSDLEVKLIDCKSHDDVSNVLKKFSTVPQSTETELDSILPRIEKCFGSPTVEEIYENLERDGSEWAKKTIKTLNRMSPTSLKVTHRSINMGRNLSLRDNLKLEYRIAYNFQGDSDMKEGIRSVLVDKDFKPKWNPKTVPEVTEAHVARFFKPVPANAAFEFDEFKNKL